MGCIIRMNSKEFLNEFIGKYNSKDFTIMIISDDIDKRKKSKFKNVFKVDSLLPPASAMNEIFINDSMKRFKKKYIKYLSYSEQLKLMGIIAKASSVDDEDVILLVSKDEYKNRYIDVLGEYIESLFGVQTCTFEQYTKDKSKYDNKSKAKHVNKIIKQIIKSLYSNE